MQPAVIPPLSESSRLATSDPTPLTTQQIVREITALKEIIYTRLDGMDRAIVVFSDNMTRAPTEVDRQINHLRMLLTQRFEVDQEKFSSVQTQFNERDVRTEQTAKDSKVAVDAALQAAKEAVGKQQEASDRAIAKAEAATAKQIDQIGVLIATNNKAIDDKVNDLKERMAVITGQDVGKQTAVVTQQTSNTSLVGIVSLVIGSLIGVGGLIMAFVRQG